MSLLTQLAATISILPPVNKYGMKRGESRWHWRLRFEFNNQGKWLAALAEIKDTANKNVRNAIKLRFDNLLASARQKREFEIEDLDAQIPILIALHDSETRRKLAHLEEQAAIARELGISKQTGSPQPYGYQSFNSQERNKRGVNTSEVETDTLLYLRGYDALEKEIELIKSRKDKRMFIHGLAPLEQKKLVLSKDQIPERAERLFAATPVMNLSGFQAASFDVNSTKFQKKSNRRALILALTVLVGVVIGVVYVLIGNAMRRRREAALR